MLVFGALADRFGRRRIMLIGLALLGASSLATAFVTTAEQLIIVRAVMGCAAAMTTPGTMALAFRLFADDSLRLRAINLISTVGLVGLAIGPIVGGFALAIAPWQVLLLVNAPVAALALIGVRIGIAADVAADLHRDPVDMSGAALGTVTVALALVAPTLFLNDGVGSWVPWATTATALLGAIFFLLRERSARYPLLDLQLVARPLVSSGLAYKAAAGLAIASLGYLVTLQLQLDWGWAPALAAIGMLPQVIVLVAGGALVNPFVQRVGLDRAAWLSATAVVCGLAVYALLSSHGYVWVAIALVLVAAGLRVVGVVAGVNVLRGLPQNRATIGAALIDTASEITSGVGIAFTGAILAALFTGDIATGHWSTQQTAEFHEVVTIAGVALTLVAAALVGWAMLRTRHYTHSAAGSQESASIPSVSGD
jgi:MFS family permease